MTPQQEKALLKSISQRHQSERERNFAVGAIVFIFSAFLIGLIVGFIAGSIINQHTHK